MGLQGAERGKGQIDQSHAHRFSQPSTATDKAVRLGRSFVMAVSPLYVTPRAKTISPLGRMSSCHSVPQQCCPLTIPKLQPLTLLCPAHASYFHTGVYCTNDTERQAQWQVRHFRLHYLAGHSFTASLRQNGEILSVILILQY